VPGRFYLVPQFRSPAAAHVKVDIAVNQQSMQEMNESQVSYYCNLIDRAADYFYSCNLEQHAQTVVDRMGTVCSLTELFNRTFPGVIWRSRPDLGRVKLLKKLFKRRRHLTDQALPRAIYACSAQGAGTHTQASRAA
jgi:hypothetical protein